MSGKLRCEKYGVVVELDTDPCPHPLDYCTYRSRCLINRLCMENADCRKKRRTTGENT